MAAPIRNTCKMLLRPALLRLKPESITRNLCTSRLRYQDNQDGESVEKPVKASKEEKQKQAKLKLSQLLETMAKEATPPAELKLNLATPKLRERRRREKQPRINFDPEMDQAIDKVSSTYTSKDSMKQALLDKLQEVAKETEKAKVEAPKPNKEKAAELRSLLNTLKVEKPERRKRPEPTLGPLKVEEVFAGKPSDIFKNAQFQPNPSIPKLELWEKLAQRELELAITHPPSNGFEKMIQWTRQGKLWHFPIDNEQGWEDEKDVGFHEHIFLEPHLDPWCPRRGPLRHFMELVCVGLSKNPYLTVAKKKEHIFWFRDFFNSQNQILLDTGVISESKSASTVSQ